MRDSGGSPWLCQIGTIGSQPLTVTRIRAVITGTPDREAVALPCVVLVV
jgi:hypothetical protein